MLGSPRLLLRLPRSPQSPIVRIACVPAVQLPWLKRPLRWKQGYVSTSLCDESGLYSTKIIESLPYGFRPCLSDNIVDRLNVAVKFSRPGSAYYSISQLPTVLTWGPGNGTSVSTDDSRFIIQAGARVRILIIGEVTKSFLRGTTKNRGSCSLNVTPLFTCDADRLESLVRGFSTSSKCTLICHEAALLYSFYRSQSSPL